MPYACSPTSCCSPSPAVGSSHSTPPSRVRQRKLRRRVGEAAAVEAAACGGGWAEVTAMIAGAKPWRQATPRPRCACVPLTPPRARSDEGRTCDWDCDEGCDEGCDADCDTYTQACIDAGCGRLCDVHMICGWCNNFGQCSEGHGDGEPGCGDKECKNECDGKCDDSCEDSCDGCNAHNQACDDSCDSGCTCPAGQFGAAKYRGGTTTATPSPNPNPRS